MITKNDLLEFSNKLCLEAQCILEEDGSVEPVIFAFGAVSKDTKTPAPAWVEEMKPVSLTMGGVTPESDPRPAVVMADRDRIGELLSKLSKESDALVLIFDGYTKETDDVVTDLESDPEKMEAILTVIYMKDCTLVKRTLFFKSGEKYSFWTKDWAESAVFVKDDFKNPYLALDICK